MLPGLRQDLFADISRTYTIISSVFSLNCEVFPITTSPFVTVSCVSPHIVHIVYSSRRPHPFVSSRSILMWWFYIFFHSFWLGWACILFCQLYMFLRDLVHQCSVFVSLRRLFGIFLCQWFLSYFMLQSSFFSVLDNFAWWWPEELQDDLPLLDKVCVRFVGCNWAHVQVGSDSKSKHLW